MIGAVRVLYCWRDSPGRGLRGDIGPILDDAREFRMPLAVALIPRSRWRLTAIELWDALVLPP